MADRSLMVEIGGDPAPLDAALGQARDSMGRFVGSANRLGDQFEGIISRQFIGNLDKLADSAKRIGGSLSLAITAPLALIAKQATETFGNMDGLRRGLATLEKDAGSLSARLDTLSNIAKLPGLGFKEAIEGDIRLRTVMNSVYGLEKAAKMSERTMLGFGNAVALVGKGKSEFDRALYGVQQLANTPFPLGEDLNIIKDAIPQVTPLLNAAFGTSRSEDFKKLGISSRQVLETILTGLEKLPKASGGVKNAIENLQDTFTKVFDRIGSVINNSFNLSALSERFSGFISGLVDKFEALSPATQKIALVMAGLAAAIGPVLVTVGGLLAIIPSVVAGAAALTAAIGISIGPIVAIGAAVAAAAGLIVYYWDEIKNTLVQTGIWSDLSGLATTAFDTIKSSLAVAVELMAAIWSRFSGLQLGLVRTAFTAVVGVFRFFAGAATGIMQTLTGLITMDWSKAWTGMLNILKSIGNLFLDAFKVIAKGSGEMFAGLIQLFGGTALADKLRFQLDGALKKVDGYRFKITPTVDVKAPVVSVKSKPSEFTGFNFAGDNAPKIVTPNLAGAGKKKKAEYVSTIDSDALNTRLFENLLKQKKELERDGQSIMPERIELGLFALAKRLGRIKDLFDGLDIVSGVKAMAVRGGGIAQRYQSALPQITPALNRGIAVDSTGADAGLIDTKQFLVNDKLKGLAASLKRQFDATQKGGGSLVDLGKSFSGIAGGSSELQRLSGEMKKDAATVEDAFNTLQAAFERNKDRLAQSAAMLFGGLGEAIGKGENPLKAGLSVILDQLANYALEIGTAALISSDALLAAAPFLAGLTLPQGIGLKVAGAGLLLAGGLIKGLSAKGFAGGGHVKGEGTSTSDSILAKLSNGEFVMKAAAVSRLGVPFLDSLNNGINPFANMNLGASMARLIPQPQDTRSLKPTFAYSGNATQRIEVVGRLDGTTQRLQQVRQTKEDSQFLM